MAEMFKVGANARELLRYTQRATRIVTDDISRSDARKIIQKVAALEDVRDIQKVCGTAVHALDTRDREGFSKSTFRLYGEGIRLTARQILLDAHAANNVNFQTDYDKRIEKIGAVIQKLRRDSSKRMKNKIRYWETAYPAGEVTKQEILRSLF